MQNSNLQEVLKSLAGQLHHDDMHQMTHLCGDITWLDTYMITLKYHENAMHRWVFLGFPVAAVVVEWMLTLCRAQQIHFDLANTLGEIVDRKLDDSNVL